MRIGPHRFTDNLDPSSDAPSSAGGKPSSPTVRHAPDDPFGKNAKDDASGKEGPASPGAEAADATGSKAPAAASAMPTREDHALGDRPSSRRQRSAPDQGAGISASAGPPGDTGSKLLRNEAVDRFLGTQQVPSPPNAREEARRFAQGWLMNHRVDADPDQIYYTTSRGPDGLPSHRGPSLTDIAMANRQDLREGKLITPGDHATGRPTMDAEADTYGQLSIYPKGPYYDGSGKPALLQGDTDQRVYDASGKELAPQKTPLSLKDYQQAVWNKDLYKAERKQFDQYFAANSAQLEVLDRANYLKSAERQEQERSLSSQGVAMARQAAGLSADRHWDQLTPEDLKTRHDPQGGVTVSPLKIRDSVSDSALVIGDQASGRQLLYLPGNSAPFHEFASNQAMNQWLATQAQDPAKRAQLVNYFPVAGRDGETTVNLPPTPSDAAHDLGFKPPTVPKVELDDFLKERGDAAKTGDAGRFAVAGSPLKGDLFQHGMEQLKRRTYDDQDQAVVSDGTYSRHKAGQIAGEIGAILAPLSIVAPELAPLVAAAGAAQSIAGVAQQVEGTTGEERKEGLQNTVFGALNALPGAFLKAAEGAEIENTVAEAPKPSAAEPPKTTPSTSDLPKTSSPPAEAPAPGPATPALPKPAAIPDSQLHDTGGGIYAANTGNYLKMNGETYRAVQDKQSGQWKVIAPDKADDFGGVYVKPDAKGEWEPVAGPGLRGGGPGKNWPWGRAANSSAENTRGLEGNELKLQQLLNEQKKQTGSSSREVNAVKEEYSMPIPPRVYRTHRDPGATPDSVRRDGLLRASGSGHQTGDDYLVAILNHTARKSGSGGQVLSLSASPSVSARFAGAGGLACEIDTTRAPGQFRSAYDIIVNDGIRLVDQGRITKATLLSAYEMLVSANEREIFYLGGDIPPDMVVSVH